MIGGGVGGLLAARALAEHFGEVIICERDALAATPEQRRGVPQGRHAHGILASGRRVLDQLFPAISNQLIQKGALSGDVVRDTRWFLEGACLSRCESGLDALLMSRPLLETTIRGRLCEYPNIRIRPGSPVDELTTTPDGRCVTGVRVNSEVVEADLVVEASGRASHTPRWLESLGYTPPPEERIEIGLGYTTRWFRRKPDDLEGDLAAVIPPTPDCRRGGVMLAQEGDQWIVTLVAHFANYAPAEMAGFIEFARTLNAPFIYQVIRTAEPVGEAYTTRFPASVWRRYDQLSRFPDQFLVFGDAISSFNPRYGQGMSVAALQAVQLRDALADRAPRLAHRFFTRAAKVVEIPWTIAARNDLRMREARGQRTAATRVINWYMSRLLRAAHHDPQVALAFHRVANLVAPPPSAMRPSTAFRVLRRNLFPSDWTGQGGFRRDLQPPADLLD